MAGAVLRDLNGTMGRQTRGLTVLSDEACNGGWRLPFAYRRPHGLMLYATRIRASVLQSERAHLGQTSEQKLVAFHSHVKLQVAASCLPSVDLPLRFSYSHEEIFISDGYPAG